MRYDWDDDHGTVQLLPGPGRPVYVVGANAEVVMDRLLAGTGLKPRRHHALAVHFGGKKVIDAVRRQPGPEPARRPPHHRCAARLRQRVQRLVPVLRTSGCWRNSGTRPGEYGVHAMGPGSTIETALSAGNEANLIRTPSKQLRPRPLTPPPSSCHIDCGAPLRRAHCRRRRRACDRAEARTGRPAAVLRLTGAPAPTGASGRATYRRWSTVGARGCAGWSGSRTPSSSRGQRPLQGLALDRCSRPTTGSRPDRSSPAARSTTATSGRACPLPARPTHRHGRGPPHRPVGDANPRRQGRPSARR